MISPWLVLSLMVSGTQTLSYYSAVPWAVGDRGSGMSSLSTSLSSVTWFQLAAREAGERGPPLDGQGPARRWGFVTPEEGEQMRGTVDSLQYGFWVEGALGCGGALRCLFSFCTTPAFLLPTECRTRGGVPA